MSYILDIKELERVGRRAALTMQGLEILPCSSVLKMKYQLFKQIKDYLITVCKLLLEEVLIEVIPEIRETSSTTPGAGR